MEIDPCALGFLLVATKLIFWALSAEALRRSRRCHSKSNSLTAKLSTSVRGKELLSHDKMYPLTAKLIISRKNLQSVRGGEVIYRSGGETKIPLGGDK